MTDTATSRYKGRQQSLGSNTNSWGDDKLNEFFRLIDRGSKGVQSLAITGDTTISWSNYVATNDGQVSVLILTGSLSSSANVTMPSSEWQWDLIKNTTGQTITVKTAAGTGIAIPNGRQTPVYCNGADCFFGGTNYIGLDITEANPRDLADKSYVDTAVANAGIPASTGAILVDGTDGTAGYLSSKAVATANGGVSLSIAGTTNKTLIAALDVHGMSATTNVAAADEFPVYDATAGAVKKQTRSYVVGDFGLVTQAEQTAGFTAVAGNFYPVNIASSGTITFPASATAGDKIGICNYGTGNITFSWNGLNFNSSTSTQTTNSQGLAFFRYTGATAGWVSD